MRNYLAKPGNLEAFIAEVQAATAELAGRAVREARVVSRPVTIERIVHPHLLELDLKAKALTTPLDGAIGLIIAAVCEAYNVRTLDLLSERRTRSVAWPRQVAMYLCIRKTKASYPRVGRVFNRDHTTCLHAVRAVEKVIEMEGHGAVC